MEERFQADDRLFIIPFTPFENKPPRSAAQAAMGFILSFGKAPAGFPACHHSHPKVV